MNRAKTLDRLRTDHQIIMTFVGLFRDYCRAIDRGEVPRIPPERVVNFINGFIERFHHAREEQVLFDHLMRRSAHDRVLARRLVHEHDETRHHIEGMRQVLDMATPDRRTAWVWNGLGYAQLLGEHITREEVETYPMVASMLTAEDEALLGERFDRVSPDEDLQWSSARDFLADMSSQQEKREIEAQESN